MQDQYDQIAVHTQKGIDFLEKYGNFVDQRCKIEQEYATKLRYVYSTSWISHRTGHRVHTEWQQPLSVVDSIMMEKLAQAGEGGRCMPTPFHYSYHHIKSCSVHSRWYCHCKEKLVIYWWMLLVVTVILIHKRKILVYVKCWCCVIPFNFVDQNRTCTVKTVSRISVIRNDLFGSGAYFSVGFGSGSCFGCNMNLKKYS